MTTFSVFSILVLLVAALFETGLCKQCLKLEPGDVSGFDTKKYEGKYEMTMAILDTAGNDLEFNCNTVELKQHDHPNGGVNFALVYEALDGTVWNVILPHFNASNEIVGIEVGAYDRFFKTWTDKYYKILLATDDILAFTLCIHDEDKDDNSDEFYVNVLRRKGSTVPISTIREILPDAIKNKPGLRELCDH